MGRGALIMTPLPYTGPGIHLSVEDDVLLAHEEFEVWDSQGDALSSERRSAGLRPEPCFTSRPSAAATIAGALLGMSRSTAFALVSLIGIVGTLALESL
jgi:hypothetical protein